MQIPKELPQFFTSKVLILVISRMEAIFYVAAKSKIEKIEHLSFPKPTYSDNEGFFEARTRDGVMGSGSVKELRADEKKLDLLRKFREEFPLTYAKIKPDQIILLCPDHMVADIHKHIPIPTQKEIFIEIRGNFENHHSIDLLKKLDKELGKEIEKARKKNIKVSAEEQKILDKFEQAQKVMGRQTNLKTGPQ